MAALVYYFESQPKTNLQAIVKVSKEKSLKFRFSKIVSNYRDSACQT